MNYISYSRPERTPVLELELNLLNLDSMKSSVLGFRNHCFLKVPCPCLKSLGMFEKWRHNGWLNYGGSILCDVCVSVFMHTYIFLYDCPPMHTCEHVHDS